MPTNWLTGVVRIKIRGFLTKPREREERGHELLSHDCTELPDADELVDLSRKNKKNLGSNQVRKTVTWLVQNDGHKLCSLATYLHFDFPSSLITAYLQL